MNNNKIEKSPYLPPPVNPLSPIDCASSTAYPDEDTINSPSHYKSYNKELNIECIDAMRAAFGDEVVAAFCKCNSMKYIWRESSKGGNESIKKAIWYLNKYLELNK